MLVLLSLVLPDDMLCKTLRCNSRRLKGLFNLIAFTGLHHLRLFHRFLLVGLILLKNHHPAVDSGIRVPLVQLDIYNTGYVCLCDTSQVGRCSLGQRLSHLLQLFWPEQRTVCILTVLVLAHHFLLFAAQLLQMLAYHVDLVHAARSLHVVVACRLAGNRDPVLDPGLKPEELLDVACGLALRRVLDFQQNDVLQTEVERSQLLIDRAWLLTKDQSG